MHDSVLTRFSVGRQAILAGLFSVAFMSCAAAADICAAPPDLTANVQPLPHVASVLKDGGTLDILTIGSATVFSPMESLQPGTVTGLALGLGSGPRTGTLPNPSEAAFPLQMAQVLRQTFPGLTVSVVVKGGRGLTAADMLALIRTETAAHHYQLVIWQTGTVEAVHNMPASTFYDTLLDGASVISDPVRTSSWWTRNSAASCAPTPIWSPMPGASSRSRPSRARWCSTGST